jgi:YD repeat-containing protein
MKIRAFVLLTILVQSVSLFAQSTDTSPEGGEKPLGTYFITDIDSVSLTNGNLHLKIPLFSLPGRETPVALALDYNSQSYERRNVGVNGQTVYAYESKQWRKSSSFMGGTLTASKYWNFYTSTSIRWTLTFVYAASSGQRHTFTTQRDQTCSSVSLYNNYIPVCANPSPADVYIYDNLNVVSTDSDYIRLWTNTFFSYPNGTFVPAYIRSKDGTRIDGISVPSTYSPATTALALTSTNGNYLTADLTTETKTNFTVGLADYLSTTDTLGRNISYSNSDGSNPTYYTVETITLQDANGQSQVYTINWTKVHAATNYEPPDVINGHSTAVNDDFKMVSSVVLPNGKSWVFTYNSEGLLSKVTFPSGAYIRYEYGHPGCNQRGHVTGRYVSADGTSGAEKQTSYSYSYPTGPVACNGGYATGTTGPISSATVTDPAGTQTLHTYDTTPLGDYLAWRRGLETSVSVIRSNQVVKRTDYLWGVTWNGTVGVNGNPRRDAEITTMGSMVRKTAYTYDSYLNVTQQDDYDWGLNAPGARLRYVVRTYLTSACTSANLCNRVTSEKTYTDGNTLVAQTDYEYDNYSGSNALVTRSGTIPGWSSPSGARGNVTAVSQWLNTNNTWLVTTQQYDVLGNKVKVTDPGTHATNTYYADRFSDNVSRNTFAYPTQVVDAAGNSVETTYDFNTGLVTQVKDAQNRITTKTYDVMNRDIQTTYPNTGFTRFTYNDTALTVKKEIKVDSAGNLGTMIVHYDGLYRETQKETYDPEGTIYVDSQYDAKGRKWKVSNPRRSAETAVWTQFSYDTLDRPKITTAPDGSIVQYDYSGNQTTVTDEAGNSRRYTYDGLGRMTMVEEPNPSLATPLITTYTYNVLGKMTQSNQSGQTRSWAFDSLGRMTSETLPESGTTTFTYGYDANANPDSALRTKTDARGKVTTMSYGTSGGALHQLVSRSYSDSTPAVSFGYNSLGLRNSMTDGLGSVTYSYDSNTDKLTQESRTLTGVTGIRPAMFTTLRAI